jgi:predicted RNA-binding protein YlqC (UPF0109 family)
MHTPAHIIEKLIAPVCTQPASLRIHSQAMAGGTCVTVTPHAADMSRLVGKGGVNVKALKAIAEGLGNNRDRVVLILADPPTSAPAARPMPPKHDWDTAPVVEAIKAVLERLGKKTMVNVVPSGEEVNFVVPLALQNAMTEALGRWVTVMAHSLGGTRAFLRTSDHVTATATPTPAH